MGGGEEVEMLIGIVYKVIKKNNNNKMLRRYDSIIEHFTSEPKAQGSMPSNASIFKKEEIKLGQHALKKTQQQK